MSKFVIEIFRYATEPEGDDPFMGNWSPTAWGGDCKTKEEASQLAQKIAREIKSKVCRVRAVEVLGEFECEKVKK